MGHGNALHDGGEFTRAQIAESYADVDFFSSINSLVDKRLLQRSVGFCLDRPSLLCCVDQKLAHTVARNLGIDLNSYLV